MPLDDHQLRAADHGKSLDNQDRNAVREQTEEAYGDEALHAETKTVTMQHFPGQPLETLSDHEANEALRAEQYERAKIDPVYRAQQKIDVDEDDIDEDAQIRGDYIPLDAEPVVDDPDTRTDVDQRGAEGSDSMHPAPARTAGGTLDEADHPGEVPRDDLPETHDYNDDGTIVGAPDSPQAAAAEQNDADREAVEEAAPDHSNDRGGE